MGATRVAFIVPMEALGMKNVVQPVSRGMSALR